MIAFSSASDSLAAIELAMAAFMVNGPFVLLLLLPVTGVLVFESESGRKKCRAGLGTGDTLPALLIAADVLVMGRWRGCNNENIERFKMAESLLFDVACLGGDVKAGTAIKLGVAAVETGVDKLGILGFVVAVAVVVDEVVTLLVDDTGGKATTVGWWMSNDDDTTLESCSSGCNVVPPSATSFDTAVGWVDSVSFTGISNDSNDDDDDCSIFPSSWVSAESKNESTRLYMLTLI